MITPALRLAAILGLAAAAHAQVFYTPVSYTGTPGEGLAQGGSFNYFDDGGSQLTDGILGGQNWYADLGNGAAQEWVGYYNADATFTFDLGVSRSLTAVGLHINNNQEGGVGLFGSASVSFSPDGTLWSLPLLYITSADQRADMTARFLDVPVEGVGRFVQVSFTDGDLPWQFFSEARFQGTAVPEPSTWAMVAGAGLAGWAGWRRTRRAKQG